MKLKTLTQIGLFCFLGLTNIPSLAETPSSRVYSKLDQFDVPVGRWEAGQEDGLPAIFVRGDLWEGRAETESSAVFNGIFKGLDETFLDSIKAFMFFPLALVKDSEFQEGALSIRVKPLRGEVDQGAGIAFGMENPASYWVVRLNALENNVMLFEWVKGRRQARHSYKVSLESIRWYTLTASIQGKTLKAYLDGQLLFNYDLGRPVKGKFGLWSKSDSVVAFRELTFTPLTAAGIKK